MCKLTSQYRITIPKAVRSALHLRVGDRIVYEIVDDQSAVIRKATPLDMGYLHSVDSTLSEWESAGDDHAYRSL